MSQQSHGAQQDQVSVLILTGLVLSGALAAAAAFADEFRALTASAAWLHLKPFAELAKTVEWLQTVPVAGQWLFGPALIWCGTLPLWPPPKIAEDDWLLLQAAAGRAAFALYGLPMLAAWIRLRRRRPDLRFRRRHGLDSLISAQGLSWPLSGIVRSFGPLSERNSPVQALSETVPPEPVHLLKHSKLLRPAAPPTLPPTMEIALRPEIWLVSQRLAECREFSRHPLESAHPVINIDDHLSVDSVAEAMEPQLGPPWSGVHRIRPALRALAAAFALGCSERSTDCEQLLTSVSVLAERSALRGNGLDRAILRERRLVRRIDDVLDGRPGERLRVIADGHAWLRPAFVAMLSAARLSMGILASSAFLWLKREDRTLWYALNAAGNNVAVAESAGVVAHYRAEQQSRQPLAVPAVNLGAKSLVVDYLDLDPERAQARRRQIEVRKPVGQRLRESAGQQSCRQRKG